MKKLMFTLVLGLALGQTFAAPAPVFTSNSEDGAQVHCPLDKIVWLDTHAHLYYFRSNARKYALTTHGGFACLQEVRKAGNKRGK